MTTLPSCARYDVVFSDVDDTIIGGKSLVGFAEQLARESASDEAERLRADLSRLIALMRAGTPRQLVNAAYYEQFLAGRSVEAVQEVAARWFARASTAPRFLKRPVIDFLLRARADGSAIVLVSGSFAALLTPVLSLLGGGTALAAPLEIQDGRYTGRLLGSAMIGDEKTLQIKRYALERGISLATCCAIGDDPSDLGFLALSGAVFVPSDAHEQVLAHAHAAQWGIL